jgi:hypothetical protein
VFLQAHIEKAMKPTPVLPVAQNYAGVDFTALDRRNAHVGSDADSSRRGRFRTNVKIYSPLDQIAYLLVLNICLFA